MRQCDMQQHATCDIRQDCLCTRRMRRHTVRGRACGSNGGRVWTIALDDDDFIRHGGNVSATGSAHAADRRDLHATARVTRRPVGTQSTHTHRSATALIRRHRSATALIRRHTSGRPVPMQMWWQGRAQSQWQGRAQSRCRCGRGEPSRTADVAGVGPVPGADVRRALLWLGSRLCAWRTRCAGRASWYCKSQAPP